MTVEVLRRDRYPIVLGSGAIDAVEPVLRTIVDERGCPSIVVLADEVVTQLYGDTLAQSLSALPIPVTWVEVPIGEEAKTLEVVTRAWQRLDDLGTSRRTLLIAFGGGATCDVVGLVASTYMRGLPYVNMPTSLIAQLDGAVGGKVGFDFAQTKNLLGAFYHPAAVIIDTALLDTLPSRQMAGGLAEAIKVAVLTSPSLFEDLERLTRDPHADRVLLTRIVDSCVAAKLRLLADDPFELHDLDRLLNFGHCIGHSVEAESAYGFHHGEAVAVGMSVASALSVARGSLPVETFVRLLRLIRDVGLPASIPHELRRPVWAHLDRIRRIRNGSLRIVVPTALGQCDVLDAVDRGAFDAALEIIDGAPTQMSLTNQAEIV